MLKEKDKIKQIFLTVLKEEPLMIFERGNKILAEFYECPNFSLNNLLDLQSRIGFKEMNITQEPSYMGSEQTGPYGGEFYFEFW